MQNCIILFNINKKTQFNDTSPTNLYQKNNKKSLKNTKIKKKKIKKNDTPQQQQLPDLCCAVATVDDIDLDDTTSAPTKSEAEKIGDKAMEIADKIGHETGIPSWGVVAIGILITLIILGICGFCIRRCFRKRRSKDGKKGKGVDMKSVQLLGSAYKEKVID